MPCRAAAAILTKIAPPPIPPGIRLLGMLCACVCAAPPAAMAGGSASYSLTPAALNTGGSAGASANYTFDTADDPGIAASSTGFISRTGFAGQLDEITGISGRVTPSPLPETTTGQLQATLLSSAGFLTDYTPLEIGWTILSGPLDEVTPTGTVTSGKVYEATPATIQITAQGQTGTLIFSVSDTLPDNFGNYAGDRLPDWWQVQHFGLNHPRASQAADPDGDNLNNLLEFAFGTHPSNSGSGNGTLTYSGGILIDHGQPLPVVTNIPNGVDFRVVFARRIGFEGYGLRYQVQFSPDLNNWTNSAATPAVLATDGEFEAVSVPWPLFVNGRKIRFFRMAVELLAPTP